MKNSPTLRKFLNFLAIKTYLMTEREPDNTEAAPFATIRITFVISVIFAKRLSIFLFRSVSSIVAFAASACETFKYIVSSRSYKV